MISFVKLQSLAEDFIAYTIHTRQLSKFGRRNLLDDGVQRFQGTIDVNSRLLQPLVAEFLRCHRSVSLDIGILSGSRLFCTCFA